ncbi:aminoglycoside 6-adenylyltransferase [Cohnella sp. JJ-181]|uniref:aminoglycoside 6-adenylyltransferase n=1 Tax=Cohnella rhizoplanae TaxID=2974897 RepID=UPI00232B0782|nr:aminoglycoside 6-adenylyltransferase [Cohnella sp. JJ-181]
MRTEQEMMALILGIARADERIRAVCMNGSRTNPNAPRDRFQDYDIVYLVTEMNSFIGRPGWIDAFGERIILQKPDDNALFPPGPGDRYAYLMQFKDGNRIDLRLSPVSRAAEYAAEDKLTVVLLDKDGLLPALPAPTDEDYRVRLPDAPRFAGCCNEFWWVSTYVAKGLWRRETLYALDHLNLYVRPMLIRMLEWRVGIDTDGGVGIGKNAKYLERYLPADRWQALLDTYPRGTEAEIWQALRTMGRLFRETALEVAERLGFAYDGKEDRLVTAYLASVERLPRPETER